ncbi:MAG: RimK family alpha-L-glutamate ligase [Leptolyngbyaceae cyanobacterium]
MHILILGDDLDADAICLKSRLENAGARVDYWNSQLFPKCLQLTWQAHTYQGRLQLPTGKAIHLDNIHSIFWRTLHPVDVPLLPDSHQYQIAVTNSTSILRSLIRGCSARWVNSWEAYQFHQEKPLQLSIVKELGVAIPKTLISNNPEHIRAFATSVPQLIFKPVYQGAYTKLLKDSYLEPEHLNQCWRRSPATFQEYVPGTNIRCYVIGQQVYAAEIRSACLDFREDTQARIIPAILPETIQIICLKIAQALFLEWTAIDWRLSPQGEFIFLKADPSPMFTYFEQITGFPLSEKLVQLLMS